MSEAVFGPEIEWEDRVSTTWQSIVSIAKSALLEGRNVIIDYVVENELGLLEQEFQQFDLRYHVLFPSSEIAQQRLKDRGDTQYSTRQSELFEILSSSTKDQSYRIDNSDLTAQETVQVIIND